jgi:hypothetical protein
MNLDRAADFIWLGGAIVLVASALVARRRLPRGKLLSMALIWLVIFVVLFGIAHWMDVGR